MGKGVGSTESKNTFDVKKVMEASGCTEAEAIMFKLTPGSRSGDKTRDTGFAPGSEMRAFLDIAASRGSEMAFDELETGIRDAARRDAAAALGAVCDAMVFKAPACPRCGGKTTDKGRGRISVLTAVGTVKMHPARFVCDDCGEFFRLLGRVRL